MQNPELKEYKTPSCSFFIPVNTAGEEYPDWIDDNDYEEQERFARWYERMQEQDLLNQENRL